MGSRAGRPNKNKQRLLIALQKEYGEDFNPVMQMAKNAHRLQGIADALYNKESDEGEAPKVEDKIRTSVVASDAWGKVAKFVTPELKSIEVTPGLDDDDKPMEWKVTIVKPNAT